MHRILHFCVRSAYARDRHDLPSILHPCLTCLTILPRVGRSLTLWVALPKRVAFWEKVPNKSPHISITGGFQTQNSPDLNMGRRPELKSDEFCGVTTLVNQLMSLLCLKPPKQVVQLLAARPISSHILSIQLFKLGMLHSVRPCPLKASSLLRSPHALWLVYECWTGPVCMPSLKA